MTKYQLQLFKEILAVKTQAEKVPLAKRLIATLSDDKRAHFNNKSMRDIDGEIWHPIPLFEGIYSVSSFGRVKNSQQILTGKIGNGGYITVNLTKGDKMKTVRLQRLIALCFHGGYKNLDAHHINGIKMDNRASNIKYATRSENIKDAYERGVNTGGANTFGTKRYNAKLTEEIVFKMRTMIKNGVSKKDIMAELNVPSHSYSSIRSGKGWPHVII